MRTPSADSAHRLGELALLTTAFVLPLAFSLHSYDPASLKFAVLQWSSLAMLFGWLWQGISRGRFQIRTLQVIAPRRTPSRRRFVKTIRRWSLRSHCWAGIVHVNELPAVPRLFVDLRFPTVGLNR